MSGTRPRLRSRTLQGAWARRGTLLPLFLLTVVVVGGVVAVVGFAAAAGTDAPTTREMPPAAKPAIPSPGAGRMPASDPACAACIGRGASVAARPARGGAGAGC